MRRLSMLPALLVALAAAPVFATVPSTASSASYTCNGTTTVYAVPFRFLASSDLVASTKSSVGAVATLVITTDYTVSGAGVTTGGTVTLTAGSKCTSGYVLTIKRTIPLTQTKSLRSQASYSGPTTEDALDKATMGLQQLEREKMNASAFRGTWSALTAYVVGDIVILNGSSYVATAASTGAQPDVSPASWLLFAAQGGMGPTGPSGVGPSFGNPGAVFYVSTPTGNDSNDCLTWTSACRTILAAYDKLPSTGGSISIADNSEVGGEVAGQGIWILGPADTNWSGSAPAGWRKQKGQTTFAGASGVGSQFGAPAMARIKPTGQASFAVTAVTLSGTTTGMAFKLLSIPGGTPSTVRIGSHDSAGNRPGSMGITALAWFTDCHIQSAGGSNGPTIDSGWTFWVWFTNCQIDSSSATANSDAHAAFLGQPPNAAGAYNGLIYFKDCRLNGGGFVQYTSGGIGGSGGGLSVEGVIVENATDSYVVRVKNVSPIANSYAVRDVQTADAVPGTTLGIFFVETGSYASVPHVVNLTNGLNGPIQMTGSGYDIALYPQAAPPVISVVGGSAPNYWSKPPTRNGMTGAIGGQLWGEHLGPKRLFAPVPSRFVNAATDIASGGGVTGPDGSNRAKANNFQTAYSTGTITPSIGDWFFFACWVRSKAANDVRFSVRPVSFDTNWGVAGGVYYFYPPMRGVPNVWQLAKAAVRVTALGGGTKSLSVVYEKIGGGSDPDVFMPTAFSAGAVDDNEAAEFFTHMTTAPIGAAAGEAALQRGQRLGFYDPNLSIWKYETRTRVAPAYGTSIAIDASLGNEFVIVPTDGAAFTVAAPTNANAQRITIRVKNTFGVLGTATWAAGYKLAAWTQPANGNSRSVDFQYDGTNWVEVSRTPADVPN